MPASMHRNATPSLLVIDLIHDLVAPEGVMAGCARHAAERGTIEAANVALRMAREREWPTFLVRVAFRPDYRDAPAHSPIFERARGLGALQEGSDGIQWVAGLEWTEDDAVLTKKGISAFCGTGLEGKLREAGCDTVLVCGVSSRMAVEATIRVAHDLGLATVMLEDACAAANEQEHQKAVQVCGLLGEVMRVPELIQFLE